MSVRGIPMKRIIQRHVVNIAAGLVLALSGVASAAQIVVTSMVGNWHNPTFNTTSSGISNITNGDPTSSINWGGNVAVSGYDFTKSMPGEQTIPPAPTPLFPLGSFTHRNQDLTVNGNNSRTLKTVKLDVVLSLTVDGNPVGPLTFTFNFNHDETSNTGTMGQCDQSKVNPTSTVPCPDVVTFTASPTPTTFQVGGVDYTLSMSFVDSLGKPVTRFVTEEHQTNVANLVGQFTVPPPTTSGPNTAPVVNAGPDQTIALSTSALLNGSVTDDGLPNNILDFGWSKVSGPGIVTFENSVSLMTKVSFSMNGVYVLRLTASDSLLTSSDDVMITVNDTGCAVTCTPPSMGAGCTYQGADICGCNGTVVCPPPPPTVQFSAASYTAAENSGVATITVTRTGIDLSGASTIGFATANGPGTLAGQNYVAVSGLLTFNPNDTTRTLDVPLINDGLADGNKSVLLTLSNPTGSTLGTPNQATLTITDTGAQNPPPPAPFISQLVPYSSPVNLGFSFTLRVLGNGFDPNGAQVLWNNTLSLPIVSRSPTEIVATVDPAVWNNTTGTYPIVVKNPGNVSSNSSPFTIWDPLSGAHTPPYVVQDPRANPNPTTTRTTVLSVLGGTFSPGGESNLTYNWQTVGTQPGSVSFSANRTHGASTVTATFSGPGTYTFKVTITDVLTTLTIDSKELTVSVVSKPTSLILSPKTQSITLDQTITLTATVKDQFGGVLSPTLNWASSGGSLSAGNTSALLSGDTRNRSIHIIASLQDRSLSDYADVSVLYGAGGVGDLTQSVPGPVPFKANMGLSAVTFHHLNPGTRIRLFTIEGRPVTTLYSPDGSDVPFNLNNSNGHRVSSGVYIYIMDWNGQTKEGKIVLIL
jgi:hypothetical protein